MSTSIDASRHRARVIRWIMVLIVLGGIAVVVLIRGVSWGSGESTDAPQLAAGRAPMPAWLRTDLAARVATALEQSTPAEHLAHGHSFSPDGKLLCAVDPFGMDPPDAASLVEVRTVFALHLCVVAEPGTPWDWSTKASGPLAAVLTDPPEIRVATAGAGYPDRVRSLIPETYQERAFGPFTDESALADLRRRFDAAAG